VPRSVGGCNGPLTTVAGLLADGVGWPARNGVFPDEGETSGCPGGGEAVGVVASGVGRVAVDVGDGGCEGDDVWRGDGVDEWLLGDGLGEGLGGAAFTTMVP
jgi:hypothetical protein